MSDRRFVRSVVCGVSPEGDAIKLIFPFEDGSESVVWLRVDNAVEFVLRMEYAVNRATYVRASKATDNPPDAVRTLVAHKPTHMSVTQSTDGVPLMSLVLEKGLNLNLVLDAATVAGFSRVLQAIAQSGGTSTKNWC